MNFLKRFFSSASATLSFLASVFQLLGIASVGILVWPRTYVPGPRYLVVIAIACALLAGLIFSGYSAVKAIRRLIERPLHPYDLVEESYELIVRVNEIVQITRLVLRFSTSGHFTHPHRYYWSGSAKPTITVSRPSTARYYEVGQSQHWTIGQFVFGQIVRSSEDLTLEFEHTIPRTTFQLYVSRIVEQKSKRLTLVVRLEDGSNIVSVARLANSEPLNEGAAETLPTPALAPGTTRQEWVVSAPIVGTHYMLVWQDV